MICLLSLIEPARQFLLREDGVVPVSLIHVLDVQRHFRSMLDISGRDVEYYFWKHDWFSLF